MRGETPGGPGRIESGGQTGRGRLAVVPRRVATDGMETNRAAQRQVRVLVVGGHQLLADSLAIALGADPGLDVVGTVTDAGLAPLKVRRERPDVVLLNNFLGDHACADLISRLRRDNPAVRVIVLTSSSDGGGDLLACVHAG